MAQCFWSFPLTFYSSDENASPLAMWESLIIVFREEKKKSVARITSPGSSNWLCCGSEVCLGCKSQQAQSGESRCPGSRASYLKRHEKKWQTYTSDQASDSSSNNKTRERSRKTRKQARRWVKQDRPWSFCVVLAQDKILMSNIIWKKKK